MAWRGERVVLVRKRSGSPVARRRARASTAPGMAWSPTWSTPARSMRTALGEAGRLGAGLDGITALLRAADLADLKPSSYTRLSRLSGAGAAKTRGGQRTGRTMDKPNLPLQRNISTLLVRR